MEVPVAAEAAVVVSLLNVLAVGEVTVVGVVVLSLMHTQHTHRVWYFRVFTVLFLRRMVTLASFVKQL